MSPEVRRAAEQDCARAATAFFSFIDEQKFEEQWDQMASDGAWDRGGQLLNSREKFLAAMAERPKVLTIRHMITNMLVNVDADGSAATATFNLLVYRYLADRGDKPAPLDPPSAIAAFTARFRPEGDTWRIAHMGGETLFQS